MLLINEYRLCWTFSNLRSTVASIQLKSSPFCIWKFTFNCQWTEFLNAFCYISTKLHLNEWQNLFWQWDLNGSEFQVPYVEESLYKFCMWEVGKPSTIVPFPSSTPAPCSSSLPLPLLLMELYQRFKIVRGGCQNEITVAISPSPLPQNYHSVDHHVINCHFSH